MAAGHRALRIAASAEARGRLAVPQEQAALYWDKKDAQPGEDAGE